MPQTRLDTARILAARRLIDPVFLDTPFYRCEALEPGLGCAVHIKLETANPVRSFKGRGTEVVARRSWRTATASPAAPWRRSCAAAMSTWRLIAAGPAGRRRTPAGLRPGVPRRARDGFATGPSG